MRVIVVVDDESLSRIEPLVFANVETLEAYYNGIGTAFSETDDFPFMIQKLKEGESFADSTHYFGWHEVLDK